MGVRRIAVVVGGLVAAVFGSVVVYAQTGAVSYPLARAIEATVRQAMARNGYDASDPLVGITVAAVSDGAAAAIQAVGGSGWAAATYGLLLGDLLPEGHQLGKPGSGGGGATGTWGDVCDFDLKFDVDGNLIIPAAPLMPSLGTVLDEPAYGADVTVGGVYTPFLADNPQGAALWWAHLMNSRNGWSPEQYLGVWRETPNSSGATYHFSHPSFVGPGGNTISNPQTLVGVGLSGVYKTIWSNGGQDMVNCPESPQTGGDFHFYLEGVSSTRYTDCIWYAPETDLSPTGYVYPRNVIWPRVYLSEFPVGAVGALSACALDDALIAELAEGLWEKAAEKAGYSGAPPVDVASTDVRHGGQEPLVSDLAEKPAEGLPGDTTEGTEPPDYGEGPEEPPVGGEGPDYDPTVSVPDPVAADIDWWPDLPTIELDFGSPACPTYPLVISDWGWDLVVDSHCQLIEDNRAMIGSIMMLLFSVGGVLIVLRA